MEMLSAKNESTNKFSRDVLILSQDTLLVKLRFPDVALSQFEYVLQLEGR